VIDFGEAVPGPRLTIRLNTVDSGGSKLSNLFEQRNHDILKLVGKQISQYCSHSTKLDTG
jgi:hypothetical protein